MPLKINQIFFFEKLVFKVFFNHYHQFSAKFSSVEAINDKNPSFLNILTGNKNPQIKPRIIMMKIYFRLSLPFDELLVVEDFGIDSISFNSFSKVFFRIMLNKIPLDFIYLRPSL